jgi:hypothetical protein
VREVAYVHPRPLTVRAQAGELAVREQPALTRAIDIAVTLLVTSANSAVPRELHVPKREQDVIERHVVAIDVGELVTELRLVCI